MLICILPPGFSPIDSTETVFSISGGSGQYVTAIRGCEGTRDFTGNPFTEYNSALSVKLNEVKLALKSSHINYSHTSFRDHSVGEYPDIRNTIVADQNSYSCFTLNPTVDVESGPFGFGFGYLWTDNYLYGLDSESPTVYMRIGRPDNFYVDYSYLHTLPLLAGGYYKIGIGGITRDGFRWWTGLGFEPYDFPGLLFKTDINITHGLYLDLFGRLGRSEGSSECAFNIGISYKITSN